MNLHFVTFQVNQQLVILLTYLLGYQRIDTLPAGAYNIVVKEETDTRHFLGKRHVGNMNFVGNFEQNIIIAQHINRWSY